MKSYIRIFSAIIFLALLGYSIFFLIKKSQSKPVIFELASPEYIDISRKTVATGSVVPRQEVNVKPQTSGVIDEIYVEAGQFISKGHLIAKIKIVPNMVTVNNAETNLATSRVNLEQAKKELERYEKLYNDKVVPEQEYRRFLVDYNLKKENFEAADANLQLVKEGATKKGQSNNLVYSTVNGMVLDVPVKIGSSVIERNNFNEGTTLCSVADMNNLVFEGKVDESEVGKIKVGMPLKLTIGAIDNKSFDANLEFISPKGILDEGAIKFLIKAKLQLKQGEFIRAGYSANADIVLEKKSKVLAVKESLLLFGKDSTYVEVETKPQVFEKRLLKTGISDGINIEVLAGLSTKDKIKVPIVSTDTKTKATTSPRIGGGPRGGR